MNLRVVTLTYHKVVMLPRSRRHYEKFADGIVDYDPGSTGGDAGPEEVQSAGPDSPSARRPTG